MNMMHPGLGLEWAFVVLGAMAIIFGFAVIRVPVVALGSRGFSLARLPGIGGLFRYLSAQTYVLLFFKLLILGLFVLIIFAGLFGTPIAERNFSTVLTWNLWWTGVIISIWLFGTSWCAICPWDLLANWMVRGRVWRRTKRPLQLNLTVPVVFRNLVPALLLLIFLTWLELGVGVTDDPYATASLALLMIVLATVSLVLYKDKAFCRYFCPIGRTIGVYSQLAPIAIRPIAKETCADCSTLDCYHGTELIAPCPTRLVMGRLQESTYCISCGNCTQSCPSNNISWQLRSPSVEAIQDARPHLDEACFMVGLLGLTSFHGITMLPDWQQLVSQLGRNIGDSGSLITTFTLMMAMVLLAVCACFALFTGWFRLANPRFGYRQIFSGFAFACLPIAFCYHVAHNLNHLVRESGGLQQVMSNPLGVGSQPLSSVERHQRAMEMLVSAEVISFCQAGLLVLGFWLSIQVVRHRGFRIFEARNWQLLPVFIWCALMTMGNLWLLFQPMAMRM